MAAAQPHLEFLRLTFPTVTAPSTIRLGIALLAAFAFALSYDALRQMAVAIHIRGLLTYAFPLVIDGFIAIGVAALLMLRTATWLSRIYVWALVGAATGTSIWANALHAIRLNQQTILGDGLRLDDATVGALSAIPPLALAGAVHLYIVIRRQPAPRPRAADAAKRQGAPAHRHGGRDPGQHPTPADNHSDLLAAPAPASGDGVPAQATPTPRRSGRPPNASLEELLSIARPVVERMGEVDRDAIAEEIRDVHGRKVSNQRLTKVTALLTEEHKAASASLLPSA